MHNNLKYFIYLETFSWLFSKAGQYPTWTYIINDNPFGNQLGIMLSDNSNVGMQVDFISAPLLFIAGIISRIKQKRRKD